MKAIGIKISIQNYDANTFFGTNLPAGDYQIAEFAWVTTPFLSGNQPIYCSYTNTTRVRPQLDPLANDHDRPADGQRCSGPQLVQGDRGLQPGGRQSVADMVTLPLYQTAAVLRMVQHLRASLPNTSNSGSPGTPRTGDVGTKP